MGPTHTHTAIVLHYFPYTTVHCLVRVKRSTDASTTHFMEQAELGETVVCSGMG